MDQATYILAIKRILTNQSLEKLLACFNRDIYCNFPKTTVDGDAFER